MPSTTQATTFATGLLRTQLACCCENTWVCGCGVVWGGGFIKHAAIEEVQRADREREADREGAGPAGVCAQSQTGEIGVTVRIK